MGPDHTTRATRPQAYHACIPTFMRRPMADPASLRPGMTAVFGIPYDYTSGSRPGARWGPRGIRRKHEMTLVKLGEVRRQGMTVALGEALARLCRRVDLLYVSIDIDVAACAYAPGTGGIVLDGLEARQLFEAVGVFARYSVAALDLVEVAPNYDPAETTIRLAAQALFQFLVERAPPARER